MCQVSFILVVSTIGCYSQQLPVKSQSFMTPGTPSAELSSIRLNTGEILRMICRWNGGSPDWEFSSDMRNPSFTPISSMSEFKQINMAACLGVYTCREKTVEAVFQAKLAGLYRCKAIPQEVFHIMWVDQTLLINRPLVKKDDYDKPLRLTCSVNLLPADIEYRREVKWYITNEQYDSEDVSRCCAADYLVDPGLSPGPMSLLIRNYDVRRDTGTFRCRVSIDGYGRELTNFTKVYAEAVTNLRITTGGMPSPIRPNQIVEALSGKQLNITCEAIGYPGPKILKLVQVGTQQLGLTTVIKSGLSATISINNLTDNFNDSFSCESTQEDIPVGQSPTTNLLTVHVRVVSELSADVVEGNSTFVLAGTTLNIIMGITIPILTAIIIVIIVCLWHQRRKRLLARGLAAAVSADGAARRSRPSVRPPLDDNSATPLKSLSNAGDHL